MTVTTATHPRRLVPGVYDFYGVQEGQYPSQYEKFMEIKDSGRKFEDLVGLAGTGLMIVKGEGAGMNEDNLAQGFVQRLIHAAYGKIVAMTWESMQDDQYDPSIASMLGMHFNHSVQDLKERLAHGVISNGFSAVSGTLNANMYSDPDALSLFNSAHKLVKGGTYSNTLATGVSLSIASIEQMVIQIRQAVNDANMRIPLTPSKLIAPVQLEFTLKKILNSVNEPFTADNTSNEVGKLGLEAVITPYLPSSTAYFIKNSNVHDGLVLFNRGEATIDADNDFRTKNALFSIMLRLSVGYVNPRCIYGAPGS